MASIGQELAEARVAKELTPKDVERYIKIRAKYISSMEADDFNDIPGQAYVLGFLKSYADFLGLDGSSMVKRYREELSAAGETSARPASPADFGTYDERQRPERSLVLLLIVIALIGGGWFGYALLFSAKNAAPAKTEKKIPAKIAPASTAAQFTITVRAIKPGGSTLIIDVDGKRVFEGVLPAGERTWTSAGEIRVEARNAQAIEILRDGASEGPLGPSPTAIAKTYKNEIGN